MLGTPRLSGRLGIQRDPSQPVPAPERVGRQEVPSFTCSGQSKGPAAMSVKGIGLRATAVGLGNGLENGGNHKADCEAHIVRQLRDKLERYEQRRSRQAGWIRQFIPTGLAPLDNALPQGGLPCGAVTEILSDGFGVGAMSLAMRIAGQCISTTRHSEPSDDRKIVLVDTLKDVYPPAICEHGIPLERFVIVRPKSHREAVWAVDQALRCPAVAVVISPLARLDERWSRRLQLAAESGGGLGLVLKPTPPRGKMFAAVQMLIESVSPQALASANQEFLPPVRHGLGPSFRPHVASPDGRPIADSYPHQITLLKVREGMPTKPLLAELQGETGIVSLHPLPDDRSAAKTG